MKKCKIEVPEIGSIVYNVGYSKAEKNILISALESLPLRIEATIIVMD